MVDVKILSTNHFLETGTNDNRPASAVRAAAYAPVWHECVLLAPEHGAHVGGVVERRVEVGVVADVGRQVHAGRRLRHQRPATRAGGERGVNGQGRVTWHRDGRCRTETAGA